MPQLLTYSKIMKNLKLTPGRSSTYFRYEEINDDEFVKQQFEERLKLKEADRKYQKAMIAYHANKETIAYLDSYKNRLKEIVVEAQRKESAEYLDIFEPINKKRSFIDIITDNDQIPAYSILV
jgi:SRSO17 transposase